jgi:hypothetical protein
MNPIDLPDDSASALEDTGVEFGSSSEGFPVARLGDLLLAMLPRSTGGVFLASDGGAAITGQVIYVDCGYQIMG